MKWAAPILLTWVKSLKYVKIIFLNWVQVCYGCSYSLHFRTCFVKSNNRPIHHQILENLLLLAHCSFQQTFSWCKTADKSGIWEGRGRKDGNLSVRINAHFHCPVAILQQVFQTVKCFSKHTVNMVTQYFRSHNFSYTIIKERMSKYINLQL
jgi:hypothetical protein